MNEFVGEWKSEDIAYKNIIFNEGIFIWGKEKGKWAIQGDEIWLLDEKSKTGTKWFFKFEDINRLIFYNPEDFNYLGKGNYFYFQMTSPKTKITFIR